MLYKILLTSNPKSTSNHIYCISHKPSGITTTKPLSVCMTTFSATLINRTVPLPLPCDCRYYMIRRMLVSPPLGLLKHTELHAHDFAHSTDL
jgi:hypothetical protein